jgi:hypothetical protein
MPHVLFPRCNVRTRRAHCRFLPQKTPFPTFTPEDHLKQTAKDMLHLLEAPAPSSSPAPTLAFGPPILNAHPKIASML